MANDLKYLKKCKDYNILKNNLDNSTLEIIESEIKKYEEGTDEVYVDDYGIHKDKNYEPSFTIQWYNGMMSTNDFIQQEKWYDEYK